LQKHTQTNLTKPNPLVIVLPYTVNSIHHVVLSCTTEICQVCMMTIKHLVPLPL